MSFPTGINPTAGMSYKPSSFQQPAEKGWNSCKIMNWSEFYGNYFFDCDTVDRKKVTISLRLASEKESVRQDAIGKAARLTFLHPNWIGDLTPSRIGELVGIKLDIDVTHSYTCKCPGPEKYQHNAEDAGKECRLCSSKVFTNAEERGGLEPYGSKAGNGAPKIQPAQPQQQPAQQPAQQQAQQQASGDGWNAPQQPQQPAQQQQQQASWPTTNQQQGSSGDVPF